jgi:hypothetical protein
VEQIADGYLVLDDMVYCPIIYANS